MDDRKLETRHSIPTGLQILLSDLDFLSQIKRNTKPCYSERVLVDSSSWSGALYRFIKGENRINVVSKIEQIINQTVDAIEAHKNSDHIKIIINYLSDSREGINSLLFVYQNDPDIKARVKVQIDIIDLQLDRFRHLIKGYHSEDSKQDSKQELKQEESKQEDDFPGMNTINLCDPTIDDEKRKLRKQRLKQTLDKIE